MGMPVVPSKNESPTWSRVSPGCFHRSFGFSEGLDPRCAQHFVISIMDLMRRGNSTCPINLSVRRAGCDVEVGDSSLGFESGVESEVCQFIDDLYVDSVDSYGYEPEHEEVRHG
jgi:hypothetical protein